MIFGPTTRYSPRRHTQFQVWRYNGDKWRLKGIYEMSHVALEHAKEGDLIVELAVARWAHVENLPTKKWEP